MTLELSDGQKITINIDEAKQLIKGLGKFVQEDNGRAKNVTLQTSTKRRKKGRKSARKSHKRSFSGMSDAKQKSILDHVNKRLSSNPQTLSHLLKGISYVPNHLPMIRKMVENQKHVSKRLIGKRMFYFLAAAENKRVGRPSKVTAVAA
ncbi:hypothetical protein [Candidatus Nitrososphaera gargensis]|uniref:hypothetical protein n=1 Tax=Candidatus Nitrososphaera gargensis TaxID=497727 RepID=UPI001E313EB5|nr:hypothetical protein [Candidatus Nitrososphaera gargensis]